jgi:predicted NAD/FAD-binding protein
MLAQVNRFNRDALEALSDPATSGQTLEQYVCQRGYGRDFFDLYLVPMSSAVWSTPPEQMLKFPAATLLRFFHNHGFLGMHTQHPWWTVDGGSREYVKRLITPWQNRIRLGDGVVRVKRERKCALVTTIQGETLEFDRVILATHANQALGLLDDPTVEEFRLLEAFDYQQNIATLHTDMSVMPETSRAWASWNYELARGSDGTFSPATHYWMNRLQGVSDRESYFVSINRPQSIAADRILKQINYAHPLFNLRATQAQLELPVLNRRATGSTNTYFAGSYFGYGFHEDGFRSAVTLSNLLLSRAPWSSTGSQHSASLAAVA